MGKLLRAGEGVGELLRTGEGVGNYHETSREWGNWTNRKAFNIESSHSKLCVQGIQVSTQNSKKPG